MNNRIVHLISMGTMIISLLIFGSFLLLFVNLNSWVYGWGHSLSMSVYLQDGIDKSTREKIASCVKDFPFAEVEKYISKEEALRDLRKALGAGAGLLNGMSHNPLPASFEIVFKNVESSEANPDQLVKALEEIDGVAEVQYSQDWLKRFEGIMDLVKLIGFVLGGLLCIGVLFIVTNTIKLTIYTRKHEIEIQKLVGATDWFIRMPFLLEGIIQGALSGLFALLILFSGYLFLSAKKVHLLDLTVLDFVFLPNEHVLMLFLISAGLGLAGSFIAVGRFISEGNFVDI
jgi:cell division transport system permease protein